MQIKQIRQIKRRQALFLFSSGLIVASLELVGCGGGSSKNNTSISDTTRKQVTSLHQLSLGARSILDPLLRRNGNFGGAGIGYSVSDAAGTTTGGGIAGITPVPVPLNNSTTPINAMGNNLLLPGAGFKDLLASASTSTRSRKYRPTRQISGSGSTTGSNSGNSGIAVGEPLPWQGDYNNFYYDYYLELWVEFIETTTQSRTNYYLDQQKTQSAGYSINTHPENWEVFPQTYTYDYQFTAGTLKGSHGTSKTTTNADYSGETSYENVYADGWKDTGKSSWFPNGASTWFSRTDMSDGQWIESTGSFQPDGTGGTRTKLSGGFEANYIYNADGSGHGKITGPDPLLPVTITWNACGDTQIQYADGTVEEQEGWCHNIYYPYGNGTTTGGTGGGIVTPDPPPAPAPPSSSVPTGL